MKILSKKIVLPLLALLLLSVTTGMNVYQHYCNGILITQSLSHESGNCCDDPGCCHDETVYIHLDNNFFQSAKVSLPRVDLLQGEPVFFLSTVDLIPHRTEDIINLYRYYPVPIPQSEPPFTGIYLL